MSVTGYFDLQANGYAGVDFNDDGLTLESLRVACERLGADGVAGILATIITADLDAMCRRLARIAELRSQEAVIQTIIAGVHIEGPFISNEIGYVGAHPPEHVLPADVRTMQRLLESAAGLTRLVTLAPERDARCAVTRELAAQKITVSAGHTNASIDELRDAIDAGLTLFTHFGNGCPPLLPRHDNILQRALSFKDQLCFTFIADGAHVPFFALNNYLQFVGIDRAIVVTDAISAAGMSPGTFTVGGRTAVVGDDLVPRCPGHSQQLFGSALTMPRAAQNLRERLQLDAVDISRLLCENPRRAIASM